MTAHVPPVEKVLEILKPLSDSERMKIIDGIMDVYCMHCGCEQPTTGRRCQCWNDE